MKWLNCLCLGLAFLLSINSFSQQNPPAQNQHSAIVEADGYVYLSDDKTLGQLREEAAAEAKRQALEKGQTHIQSFTKVENYQLTYDLIQSEAEGLVRIINSKDHGVTQDNRYHVWIQAEIVYTLKSESEKSALSPEGPLTVSVKTDCPVYTEGQTAVIQLKGNKDFYARIVLVPQRGTPLQLLPNQIRQNNLIPAGQWIAIPGPEDQFQLTVRPPFGRDQIIVYASTAPQGKVQTAKMGSSLLKITENVELMGQRTRGLVVEPAENKAKEAEEFYETSCEIVTKAK